MENLSRAEKILESVIDGTEINIIPQSRIEELLLRLHNSGGGGGSGKSAYDLAVENGFEGTVDEWLESLHGKSYMLTNNDKLDIANMVHDTSVTVRLTNKMSGTNINVDFDMEKGFSILYEFISKWNTDNSITGNGLLQVSVNGEYVKEETIVQGNNSFDPLPYVIPGQMNTVLLSVTDSLGNTRSLPVYNLNVSLPVVYHTVNYYVNDEIKYTQRVLHGTKSKYNGDPIAVLGYFVEGWDVDTSNVVDDMDVHAVLSQAIMPTEIKDVTEYDYLYTNDPNYTSAYTYGELYAIMYSDRQREFISLGDRMCFVIDISGLTDKHLILKAGEYNHYRDANNPEKFIPISWVFDHALNATRQMNGSATNTTSYVNSAMARFYDEVLYPNLPELLKNITTKAEILTAAGGTSYEIIKSEHYIFGMSSTDVYGSTTTPGINQVDADAEHQVFSIFTNTESRRRRFDEGRGSYTDYWLRDMPPTNSSSFYRVNSNGSLNNFSANFSYGVVGCLCTGAYPD